MTSFYTKTQNIWTHCPLEVLITFRRHENSTRMFQMHNRNFVFTRHHVLLRHFHHKKSVVLGSVKFKFYPAVSSSSSTRQCQVQVIPGSVKSRFYLSNLVNKCQCLKNFFFPHTHDMCNSGPCQSGLNPIFIAMVQTESQPELHVSMHWYISTFIISAKCVCTVE